MAEPEQVRGRAFVALLISVLILATGAGAAWGTTGESSGESENIRICHATNAESNPYRIPPVANAGRANAHMEHTGPIFRPGMKDDGIRWGDIIPPFEFDGELLSLNWDEEGMAIWTNGCVVPAEAECPEGEVPGDNGECVPEETECPDGEVPGDNGECVPEGSGGSTPPDSGGGNPAGPTVLGEQASTGGQGTAGGVAGSQGAVNPNAPAVPTAVDAGLAPASTGSGEALLARGLVGFGFVLMLWAGLLGLRDRRRGANRA